MPTKYTLIPFTPSSNLKGVSIDFQVGVDGGILHLEYALHCKLSRLEVFDQSLAPKLIEGLYNHTCFELFLLSENGKYIEWNFSPSLDWCVFTFDSYRSRVQLPWEPPEKSFSAFVVHREMDQLQASMAIDLKNAESHLLASSALKMQACAVIKTKSKELSYWALKHATQKPDFHAADCFIPLPTRPTKF